MTKDQAKQTKGTPKSDMAQTIVDLKSKNAELLADLQRTRADFENFRKQSDIQKQHHADIVQAHTVSKLLPLLDDIDRAATLDPASFRPLLKNLAKTMTALKLQKIDSNPGSHFNPDLHEAIAVTGEGAEELIAESVRSGYCYDGKLLRPALVKVKRQ